MLVNGTDWAMGIRRKKVQEIPRILAIGWFIFCFLAYLTIKDICAVSKAFI